MSTTIISAQTTAATGDFSASKNTQQLPATLFASGLAGAEVANVMFSADGGLTYTNLFENGTQVQLTATNNAVTIYGPGMYRVSKGITVAAVPVSLSTMASA